MELEYKTVAKEATAEIEEKKSRFIASVKPVDNEEEAAEFINKIKGKYWDATHNVYAYYICNDGVRQKYSDDGEPSGTAGMPVLEAIKKLDVRDVVVVVTRYFGGTLLGAAGLVRAYGKSAITGLEAAGIIKKQLCEKVQLTIEYELLGKMRNMIEAAGYAIAGMEYGQDVGMSVYVPLQEYDRFVSKVNEAANARVLIAKGGMKYVVLGGVTNA